MTRVLVAGDIAYNSLVYLERFPEPRPQTVFSQRYHETVGGTAAGKALNLHRLGVPTTLHGLLGDDAPGAAIRAVCAREGLPLVSDPDPQGTQRHINLMAADGGRISIYVAYGTFEPILDLSRLEALIRASDLVVLNLSNYCRRLIAPARAHGKPIWVDLHDYDGHNPYHGDFIAGADVLTLSSDALPDYRAFMQAQIAAGKRLVICTHGRAGATALDAQQRWIDVPALTDYPQCDTNGAGDSFLAGVLWGHLRGLPLEVCLRLGAIVAGLCVSAPELYHPTLSPALVEAEYARHYGG